MTFDMGEVMQKWKSLLGGMMASRVFPGILGILWIFTVNAFAMDEHHHESGHSRAHEELKEPPVSSSGVYSILDGINFLHGFADAGFGFGSKRGDQADRPRGFTIGSLDLYLTPQLGDRLKSLVELIFEFEEGGDLVVELERLQLGYAFSDNATVWLGRFHTPFGVWNTAFHHGAQMQTPILRPRFIDFEDKGGILPAHTVGVWGVGKAGLASGKLTCDLYAGNGPKIKDVDKGGDGELDTNNVKDDNNDFSVGANIGYEFGEALEGLKLGTHWFRGVVDGYGPSDARLQRSELNVVGGYLFYVGCNWEAIAEFYQFLNRDRSTGTGTHSSQAGFVQLAYSFAPFTPYVRFEASKLDQGDSYFNQQKSGRSYSREAFGIRYDLSPKSALKLEGNHTSLTDRGSESFDEIRAQFAIRF